MCSVAIMKPKYTATRHDRRWIFGALAASLFLILCAFLINEKNWRPLKNMTTWNATTNYSSTWAKRAIDRNMDTAWSSYAPITTGMYFQITLKEPTTINGIVLHIDEETYDPRLGWIVKVSTDSTTWREVSSMQHFIHDSMLVIFFQPTPLQKLQIIQTSISSTGSPWVIHEINLMQPIVPWQFTRAVFLYWLIGWCICAASIGYALFLSSALPLSRKNSYRSYILVIISGFFLLVGWFLRVTHLTAYEFTFREMKYFPILDFQSPNHLEWLKTYFEYSKTGISWFILLCIRWVYQGLHDPRMAMRIIPAIACIGIGFLMFFLRKLFMKNGYSSTFSSQNSVFPTNWEGLLTGSLISVSGYMIWLSRRGDFSIVFLLIFVGYIGLSHYTLYQRAPGLLWPVLAGVLIAGFSITPLSILLPLLVLGTFLFSLIFPLPGSRLHQLTTKQRILRACWYVISMLPLEIGLGFFPQILPAIPEFVGYRQSFEHLLQALEFSGLSGNTSLLWWTFILIGLSRLFQTRQSGEWICYTQILLFVALTAGFSASSPFPTLLIIFLLMLLLAKGIHTTTEWASVHLLNLTPASDYPLHVLVLLLVSGYFAVFSTNSLFIGNHNVPYADSMYQRYTAEQRLDHLLQQIKTALGECHVIVSLDKKLTEAYSATYGIIPKFVPLAELKWRAELGQLDPYILLSNTSKGSEHEKLLTFLQRYYTPYGSSAGTTIYQIKEEFQNLPQRFPARTFHRETGEVITDRSSFSQKVLTATPADPPGLLVSWPTIQICTSGQHAAHFALWSEDGKDSDVVVTIEIIANMDKVLARQKFRGRDFTDSDGYLIFEVPFEIDSQKNPAFRMNRLLFRIYVTAKANVRLDYIELIPPSQKSASLGYCRN